MREKVSCPYRADLQLTMYVWAQELTPRDNANHLTSQKGQRQLPSVVYSDCAGNELINNIPYQLQNYTEIY